ncbi:UNVERIFIED_CONTAM: hypothetical protein FKN15_069674 [Acipenser sinensis]
MSLLLEEKEISEKAASKDTTLFLIPLLVYINLLKDDPTHVGGECIFLEERLKRRIGVN